MKTNVWIPIDEQLPKMGEYVLTWWKGSHVIAEVIEKGKRKKKLFWSSQDGEEVEVSKEVVTYWQYMTKPE